MRHTITIFKRELAGYFATPVAYVFIVFFLILQGLVTFQLGGLYERGTADMRPFFHPIYHTLLYLILIPAISMRLWAEERRSGTIELLLTLPIPTSSAVLGKFFAAWVFVGVALLCTVPTWITVAWLGDPDHAVILTGYLGSFLMAGSFLAIGAFASALTKNQVIAFVVSVVLCLLFMLMGFGVVEEFFRSWAPDAVLDTLVSFSFITHFQAISRGVIDARDLLFFVSLIVFWLFANTVVLDLKKAA